MTAAGRDGNGVKREFRNRAFLPVVLPLAIIGGVATCVAAFALVLLYNTKEAALVIAAVSAGGILVAVALAASQDELSGAKRVAVWAAGLLPVGVGAVFAVASAAGAVDPALLNINRLPHLQVPDDAVIAAEGAESFCLPTESGCEETREWSVAEQGAEAFVFLFENLDPGVPHNVDLFTLADEDLQPDELGADSGGEELFDGDIFPGVAERTYQAPRLEAGRYLFQCEVHQSTMVGILTVTEAESSDG